MSEERRSALINGGGQGIGRATAVRLLQDGWAVTIADIDEEAGLDALDEHGHLGLLHFVHTDVAIEAQVRRAIEAAAAHGGGLDLVMNSVYVTHYKPITEVTLDEWNRVMAVNLTSAFLNAKYAEPHLRARRGSIVNIASTRALMACRNADAYGATKGGLIALTHGLAVSLGPDVRVNCICPGWVDCYYWAKRSRRRFTEWSAERHGQHPGGRMGKPEDIAAAVAYLASPEAAFITGENFIVDGGMTRKMIYE